MKRPILAKASAVCLLICLLGATPSKPHTLTYLHPHSIDYAALLPAPPAKDSAEEKAELDTIFHLQQTRSEADVERAKSEAKFTVFAFKNVMGEHFREENLPLTKAFFAKVESDAKFFTSAAKNHWARKRPPFVDSRLHAAVELEDEPSYPSSHSARGLLYALVLAEIDPAKRDELISRGQEIGWDRVIAGVHYPSDVAAGRVLGQAEFNALMKTPGFVKDLDAVKAELHEKQAVTANR